MYNWDIVKFCKVMSPAHSISAPPFFKLYVSENLAAPVHFKMAEAHSKE
jgi:hypothetical protein